MRRISPSLGIQAGDTHKFWYKTGSGLNPLRGRKQKTSMFFSLLTSLNRSQKSRVFLSLDVLWMALAFFVAQLLTSATPLQQPGLWDHA